jgi:hypothetical protein
MMVSNPLLIVRELGEALCELPKFTDFVRGVRCLHQFNKLGRFGAILLGGEHGKPFCENINISSNLMHILCKVAHFREIKVREPLLLRPVIIDPFDNDSVFIVTGMQNDEAPRRKIELADLINTPGCLPSL